MSLFRKAALGLALALATPVGAEPATFLPALLPGIVGATELIASDRRSGLALSGYCPVGYLVEGRARPGLARYEASFGGLAWRFGSGANRAAFLRDPAAFLPQVGGYDAIAAAAGHAVSADPNLFVVQDGRLYLFRNAEGRARFLGDRDAAAASERGWRRLRAGLVAG